MNVSIIRCFIDWNEDKKKFTAMYKGETITESTRVATQGANNVIVTNNGTTDVTVFGDYIIKAKASLTLENDSNTIIVQDIDIRG